MSAFEQSILKTLEEIRSLAGDDERAHVREDDLRRGFIFSLAHGLVPQDEIARLAALVLTSEEIEFERWCA